jgi:putative ABC transport system permease protein
VNFFRTFDTGIRGLLGHRLRSILTTLGILFGVAAVICTVGIGTASADSVNSRIAALGTNLLTVSPGSTTSFGVRGGAGSANTLTMEDVSGLEDKQDAPDVAAVAPVVQGTATLVSTNTNWSTTVQGSTPGWLMTNARTLAEGVFLTQKQVTDHARLAQRQGLHQRGSLRRRGELNRRAGQVGSRHRPAGERVSAQVRARHRFGTLARIGRQAGLGCLRPEGW